MCVDILGTLPIGVFRGPFRFLKTTMKRATQRVTPLLLRRGCRSVASDAPQVLSSKCTWWSFQKRGRNPVLSRGMTTQVKRVAVLPGDGIGPEVMQEALKVCFADSDLGDGV